jgi:hypothetical protein
MTPEKLRETEECRHGDEGAGTPAALAQRLVVAYDTSDIERINSDIRLAVRASGRSVASWGRLLGIPRPNVSRWLSGGTLPVRHLKKICENL